MLRICVCRAKTGVKSGPRRYIPGVTRLFLLGLGLLSACESSNVGGALLDAGPRGSVLLEPLFERVDVGLGTSSTAPNLFDVAGTGSDDIWIVGERNTILHFDGAAWALTDLTATTTRTESLMNVHVIADDNVYVVGSRGMVLHYYIPEAERRNEDAVPRWFTEPTDTSVDLNAISGGPNNLYAVGNAGTVLERDAMTGTWTTLPQITLESLHGLWVSRDGSAGTAVGNLGAILHLSGGTWSRERIPGLTVPLREVWGRSPDNLLILGLDGTLLRGSAGAFEFIEGLPQVFLRGVHGQGGNDVWLVAWAGTILRLRNNQPEPFFEFTEHRLENIWTTQEDDPLADPDDAGVYPQRIAIWVVGVSGTVLKGPFGLNARSRPGLPPN